MLGSVISKRWVVSLALVGLVSLFMASFSAGWADPASASTTTVSSTPTATPVTGQTLTSLVGLTGAGGPVTVPHGSTTIFSVEAQNESGGTTLAGTITYLWSISGCGSISSPANTSSITYTAAAGCTATLMVHAQQNGAGQVDAPNTTITVGSIPPTATPVATVVSVEEKAEEIRLLDIGELVRILLIAGLELSDAIDVAEEAIFTVGGSQPVTYVAPPANPAVKGTTIKFKSFATGQVIIIRLGATSASFSSANSSYLGASSSDSGFDAIQGSSAVDISIFDVDGNKLENFRLDKPAEVCLPYTDEDLATAYGGIDGMAVYHYNGVDWVKTNSSVDLNNKLVCGFSSTFSPFALGLAEAPPAPPGEAGLPVTGDYSPSFASLMMALMAGVALVGGGVFTLRRARRVRENG